MVFFKEFFRKFGNSRLFLLKKGVVVKLLCLRLGSIGIHFRFFVRKRRFVVIFSENSFG